MEIIGLDGLNGKKQKKQKVWMSRCLEIWCIGKLNPKTWMNEKQVVQMEFVCRICYMPTWINIHIHICLILFKTVFYGMSKPCFSNWLII